MLVWELLEGVVERREYFAERTLPKKTSWTSVGLSPAFSTAALVVLSIRRS
jgi:hypothetical protein